MTPYAIFVVVLTMAYIIYYGYHISKDLYGKKEQPESVAEEFDFGGMAEGVVPTPVRETGDGFSLGDNPGQRAGTEPPVAADDAAEKLSRMMDGLDETDVTSEGGKEYPELEQMMLSRSPDLVFRKSTVKQSRETV